MTDIQLSSEFGIVLDKIKFAQGISLFKSGTNNQLSISFFFANFL